MKVPRIAWSLPLPLLLLAGYQVAAVRQQSLYFPPLGDIARAFRSSWLGIGFTQDVVPSLINLAAGYTVGVATGLVAGIALGRLRPVHAALSPVVSFTLTLPPVALLPIFIAALGVGRTMQVCVIAFGVFFLVAVATADALRGTEPVLLDMASVFGIRRSLLLLRVLLPAATPHLLGALRAALSLAVLVMVVSELFGAAHGIGAATLLAQQSFLYPQMWAGMVLVAILGIALNGLFSLAERPALRRSGLLPTTTSRRTAS